MRPSTLAPPIARSPRLLATAVACLAVFPAACLASFAAAQQKSAPEPLAVLAGEPIYESQLPPEQQAQLLRMRQQVDAVRFRALHAVLDPKLVDAEAKKKGLTTQELLQSEVLSKVADPTGDQVEAYYRSHPAQFQRPLDEVRDTIRQGLKDLDIQKARMAYIQGLFQQAVRTGELTLIIASPPRPTPPYTAASRTSAEASTQSNKEPQ
jgi:hypothetical protein